MTERVIRVILDDGQLSDRLDAIESQLENVEGGARKAGDGFRTMAAGIAAGTAAAVLVVRELTQAGDELIRLENRLRTVTDTQGELRGVQEALIESSFRTRTALADQVELFTRASAATENLGLSQQTVIDLTESLSLGLQIGGATAAEASGAITQFTQGLALGRFETQELKSVLEQSVPISRALQKEFNATQGELLKLAENGELAADRVVNALTGDTLAEFREQLDETVVTTEVGFDQMTSAFTLLVGSFSDGLNLSEGLGKTFNDLALIMVDLRDDAFALGLAIETGIITAFANADDFAQRASIGLRGFFLDVEGLFTFGDDAEAELAKQREGLVAELEQLDKESAAILAQIDERRARATRERFNVTTPGDEDTGPTGGPQINQTAQNRANAFFDKLTDQIEDAKLETQLFGEELDEALLRLESERAIEDNEGLNADKIREATEALIEANRARERAIELRENQANDTEFIEGLELEAELIGKTAEEEERLLALRELSADATDEQKARVVELIEAQQNADREDFIASLEDELALVGLTNEERQREIALRELGAEATEEQKQKVLDLIDALEEERQAQEALEEARDFVIGIARDTAGILTDSFKNGFDDIDEQFADLLTSIGDQLIDAALDKLIQDIFSNAGGGAGGGVAGGIVNLVAGLFAGGRNSGGDVPPGLFSLVGETQPELVGAGARGLNVQPFQALTAGDGGMGMKFQELIDAVNAQELTVNNINDIDDMRTVSVLASREGVRTQLNTIGENDRAVARTVGARG